MKRALLGLAVLFLGCPGGDAICGDDILDATEGCDDGNTLAGDGCDEVCVTEFCGDAVINNNNEGCDDGNDVAGDGCDACVLELCGDNIVNNNDEECDDGNTDNGDGCDATCITEFCGDNIINNNDEGCDDGNLLDGDGCDSTCLSTGCGSGILTDGEFCYGVVDAINVGNSPQGVVVADLNGDGHQDVAATSVAEQVFVFFGDGSGGLTQQPNLVVAANSITTDISASDIDKDGDIDLLVVNGDASNPGQINIFLNNSLGGFGAPVVLSTQFFTRGLVIDDFDGDTNLDIVVPEQNSGVVQRFFGDGAGNFSAATALSIGAPFGANSGDVNGDGSPDVLVRSVGFSGVSLFLNLDDGSGDFAAPVTIPTTGPALDAKVFDFDANGTLDLAVTVDFGASPDRVTFFSNSGAAFSQVAEIPVGSDSTTLDFSDLDGDGLRDMVQLDFQLGSYFISAGSGGFGFGAPGNFPANFPAQFAIGDLNEDGLQDLVLANQAGTLRVSLFAP